MFKKLFSNRRLNEQAHEVYNLIVDRARDLRFYQEPISVEDTVEGRFELILIHVFLADTAMSKDANSMPLRRAVRELLVKDMDRSLREMGIGDMSISKQMKKVGAALISRLASLEGALQKETDHDKLSKVKEILDRNMDFASAGGSENLARYIMGQMDWIEKTATANWSLDAGLFN